MKSLPYLGTQVYARREVERLLEASSAAKAGLRTRTDNRIPDSMHQGSAGRNRVADFLALQERQIFD